MRNIIGAELIKMKKNYTLLFSALIVFALPVFRITVAEAPPFHIDWVMINILYAACIVLPIMSGFVITMLVQREYQDQTVINVLVSPVTRSKFILSKLATWLIWYLITSLITMAIYIAGFYVLYPEAFTFSIAMRFAGGFFKTGMLSFIASLPLMWITVMQRKMFYPSLIAVLLFTVIQVRAVQASESSILLLSITPWSAVTLNYFGLPAPYSIISIISIFMAGIAGIALSCFSFSRQDQ